MVTEGGTRTIRKIRERVRCEKRRKTSLAAPRRNVAATESSAKLEPAAKLNLRRRGSNQRSVQSQDLVPKRDISNDVAACDLARPRFAWGYLLRNHISYIMCKISNSSIHCVDIKDTNAHCASAYSFSRCLLIYILEEKDLAR